MQPLRVALAQINARVGDIAGNAKLIAEFAERARAAGAEVVCFPELALTGYPPEDLLLRRSFIEENLAAIRDLASTIRGITSVVGFVDADDDIFNAAAVIHDGAIAGVYRKHYLPNYGVFDENRYFQAGTEAPIYRLGDTRFGVNICEDIWYPGDPLRAQAQSGAELILNINGSPYHLGKSRFRETMLATRAADHAVNICYVNLVGGQDELVFDGGSCVVDAEGRVVARAAQFAEELLVVDVNVEHVLQRRLHDPRRRKDTLDFRRTRGVDSTALGARDPDESRRRLEPRLAPALTPEAEVYAALVTGTRDYVRKTGFKSALVGLSGGIDSALTAAVAADALGKDAVWGVAMPSRYSSEGSITDAKALAEALGIRFSIIPIEPVFAAYSETLAPSFEGGLPGVAEENVQSRIRGNLLMALSNRFGHIVLTTGNKSEYATGYCTLYGDMAGGYAVIKDVPKTLVYRVAAYRNTLAGGSVIPESTITKPPSAELRPGQLDTDSLPSYDVLDPVLEAFVEEDLSFDEVVAMGNDPALVRRVFDLVNRSEYKRRQSPPGVKITPRAFGRDRRLPLANAFRDY